MAKKAQVRPASKSGQISNGDAGEDWSLHPGVALRRERGITAKE
jgi:hypothetical protein